MPAADHPRSHAHQRSPHTPLPTPPEPSDHELIQRVRDGDVAAYGVLYTRYAARAVGLATRLNLQSADAMDVVHNAFHNILVTIRSGGGPTRNFRAYLFETVRRATAHASQARTPVPVADIHDQYTRPLGSTGARFDGRRFDEMVVAMAVVGEAFRSLPWRWRMILWDTIVLDLDPAEVALHLRLSTNAAAALRLRALRGLQARYRVLTHPAHE